MVTKLSPEIVPAVEDASVPKYTDSEAASGMTDVYPSSAAFVAASSGSDETALPSRRYHPPWSWETTEYLRSPVVGMSSSSSSSCTKLVRFENAWNRSPTGGGGSDAIGAGR